MTEPHDQISDVMAFAAANPDLYALLLGGEDLSTLELGDDRTRACEAAREHIIDQSLMVLRGAHVAYQGEMNGLIEKSKRLSLRRSGPWWWKRFWGAVSIDFWVTHLQNVGGTFQQVPLLVTLCTDTQGRGLDDLAGLLEGYTKGGAVRHKIWRHPRIVWRAVALKEGEIDTTVKEAVRGLREFHAYLTAARPNLKLDA